MFLTTSRWLAVRLDAICALFVIAIAFGSLILANSKYCVQARRQYYLPTQVSCHFELKQNKPDQETQLSVKAL